MRIVLPLFRAIPEIIILVFSDSRKISNGKGMINCSINELPILGYSLEEVFTWGI